MTTSRLFIMLLLSAVLFGVVFAAQHFSRGIVSDYLDNMPIPPATVTSAVAREESWQTLLEAPGTLVAELGADVSSESGGIVTHIHTPSGSQVKAGQLMIELDSATDAAELKRLEAQAELARLNYQRRKKLFDLEAVSKSDIEVAESEYAATRAAVKAQRAKLANKRIHAPFAGDVGIMKTNIGNYLNPGQAAVTVRRLDPMLVDFELPERWVGRVEKGMSIRVSTEAHDQAAFQGRVDAIEPQIDAQSRNLRVRGKVPNPERKLVPGQFAQVQLELPEQSTFIIVPRTAIDYSAYGTSVYVLEPREAGDGDASGDEAKPMYKAVRRFVKLGAARGDVIAVTSGLSDGERVASSGLVKLSNGSLVIVDENALPATTSSSLPQKG